MENFDIEIVTPMRKAFSDSVEAVYVPTDNGTLGVLARHVSLFCSLSEGEIKVKTPKGFLYFAIGGGFMQVKRNNVTILVSRAVHADEINEAEIKKAYQSAKDAITRQVKGAELDDAQAVLRRSLIEFKVLRHRRRLSV